MIDHLNKEQKVTQIKSLEFNTELIRQDSSVVKENDSLLNVINDHRTGDVMYYIQPNSTMICYYNILSKSQITYNIDKQIPLYNATVTTKDHRIFIIGWKKDTYELYLSTNSL